MLQPFQRRISMVMLIAVAVLVAGPGLSAQDTIVSFVTSTGSGTVYTRPTHAVFWLHDDIAKENLESALKAAGRLGTVLREFTTVNELRPTLFEVSTPAITSLADSQIRTTIELQFSMAPFAGGEAGAAKFGALCDLLKAFSKENTCQLSTPEFITTEEAAVVQNAVEEATKNAYTAAAGAARALGATIRSVDVVEVGQIKWNAPAESKVTYPTIEQIACTAEAKITYLLEYP